MKKEVYIFTYGTLMKGFYRHSIVEDFEFIDNAVSIEKYQMYPEIGYNYPFVLKSIQNHFVHGEVYKLNDDIKDLKLLDEIEGYPILYTREVIQVKLYKGETIKALMYFKNEDNYKDLIKLDEPIRKWTKEISSEEI